MLLLFLSLLFNISCLSEITLNHKHNFKSANNKLEVMTSKYLIRVINNNLEFYVFNRYLNLPRYSIKLQHNFKVINYDKAIEVNNKISYIAIAPEKNIIIIIEDAKMNIWCIRQSKEDTYLHKREIKFADIPKFIELNKDGIAIVTKKEIKAWYFNRLSTSCLWEYPNVVIKL